MNNPETQLTLDSRHRTKTNTKNKQQKTNYRSKTDDEASTSQGWTKVRLKGKEFLFLRRHQSFCSYSQSLVKVLTKVMTTATWQGSEPLLFEELFVSPDSIYYSDIYYIMSVLLIHLHLYISVSFYTSFASSTFVMGIYMILIYRNYQKDLRKMYQGDFSFLPTNVSKHDNKNFVLSILFDYTFFWLHYLSEIWN
jgi:hypothetical protein